MTIDDDLRQIREDIKTWAERCEGITPTKHQGNECDINARDSNGDPQGGGPGVGDSVLFSAVLCYSGESWACESVRRSQGKNGRMWRSPQRVENDTEATFSRDHLLGTMLYMVTLKKTGRGDEAIRFGNNLWGYVAQKRRDEIQKAVDEVTSGEILIDLITDPIKTLDIILGASIPSRYRLCGGKDDICSISLIPYGHWGKLMLEVWKFVGASLATSKSIQVKVPLPGIPDIPLPIEFSLDEYSIFDSNLIFLQDDAGVGLGSAFHDHLSLVAALLLREIGQSNPASESKFQEIASRNPNPLFLWAAGRNSEAKNEVIRIRPPNPQPENKRKEWAWESAFANKPWEDSLGWDFVAVINLLLGDLPRPRIPHVDENTSHIDSHGDLILVPEIKIHGDTPIIPEVKIHGDTPIIPEVKIHGDAPLIPPITIHGDTPLIPPIGAHIDTPAVGHIDFHGDVPVIGGPHGDVSGVLHGDAHTDTPGIGHGDAHTDTPGVGHIDAHTDTPEVGHIDAHTDTPEVGHIDAHTDTPEKHFDIHSDAPPSHFDHSDAPS
jgi:hypothetical protein